MKFTSTHIICKYHSFELGMEKEKTGLLMDYGYLPVGMQLNKYEWDIIHDPGIVTGLFQSDTSGQLQWKCRTSPPKNEGTREGDIQFIKGINESFKTDMIGNPCEQMYIYHLGTWNTAQYKKGWYLPEHYARIFDDFVYACAILDQIPTSCGAFTTATVERFLKLDILTDTLFEIIFSGYKDQYNKANDLRVSCIDIAEPLDMVEIDIFTLLPRTALWNAFKESFALLKSSTTQTRRLFTNIKNVETEIPLNRLNHIFGKPEHALESLVNKFGSQEKTYNAVQKAANQALKSGKLISDPNGILPKIGEILDVEGIKVQLIGGKIANGKVIISSFSRKEL